MPAVRRVAFFSTRFCQYSQTFVYEEVRNHQRYAVEIFCRKRINAELFPYEPVHVDPGPLYRFARRSARFDRLFRSRDYALVHAHFGTTAINAAPFARRFKKPLVVTFQGYDVPLLASYERLLPRRWTYALLGPRMLEQMTLGLCVSRDLLELLREIGVPEEKLLVHNTGIDLEKFKAGRRDPERPQVTMVGRFVEKKGFEYGIRAFAKATRHHAAHLTLAGGGPLEERYRKLVADLGISERVHFAGVLPASEVAALLGRSDVVLVPSVVAASGNREGAPTVIKEASAAEAVPIGSYHGGISELITDGETGFLAPERDVDALAAKLDTLLAHPEQRAQLAKAARHRMELEFDARKCTALLEERYDEAIRRFA